MGTVFFYASAALPFLLCGIVWPHWNILRQKGNNIGRKFERLRLSNRILCFRALRDDANSVGAEPPNSPACCERTALKIKEKTMR